MTEKADGSGSSHNKAIIAAELGAAGITVGAAALTLWQRQRRNARTFERSDYEARAAIFQEKRLSEDKRQIMAQAAARIYLATLHSASGVITRDSLLERMSVPKAHLNQALGYLSDKGSELIDRRPAILNTSSRGYFATEALVWVVDEGIDYDMVQQAVADVINDEISGN